MPAAAAGPALAVAVVQEAFSRWQGSAQADLFRWSSCLDGLGTAAICSAAAGPSRSRSCGAWTRLALPGQRQPSSRRRLRRRWPGVSGGLWLGGPPTARRATRWRSTQIKVAHPARGLARQWPVSLAPDCPVCRHRL